MKLWTRRSMILAAGATAGCAQNVVNQSRSQIDSAVAQARDLMFSTIPGTQSLADRANGVLIMPNVAEAGFLLGGSYGEGALIIGEATVQYFSVAGLSYGIQIGAQKKSHALFFMNEEALFRFRNSDGWEIGGEAQFTIDNAGAAAGLDTTTGNQPIIALVFNQRGLIAGATLQTGKYSTITR